MCSSFPTSSNFSKVEETYKDNTTTIHKVQVSLVWVSIDRQSYKYTSKTTDEEDY